MRNFLDRVLFERHAEAIVREVKARKLTYLSSQKILVLVDECRRAVKRNTASLVLECGCALGGSAAIISRLRPHDSLVALFDTFEGMPPPTENDSADVHARYEVISSGNSAGIDGDEYYGYRKDLQAHVRAVIDELLPERLARSTTLVKGLVQNTLPHNQVIAFAHIDVDWYDPVKVCAQTLFPNLEVGGSLVFDDYSDYESCRRAVDEYFDDKQSMIEMDTRAGSCRIRRIAAT